MNLTPQITFRNIDETPAILEAIQTRIDTLDHFYSRIMGCRVLIESPHNHHRHGRQYHVRIDITVPGKEIVVNHEPTLNREHTDLYIAIKDAFNAANRQIQEFAQKRRGHVKTHEMGEPSVIKNPEYENYENMENYNMA